MKKRLLAGCVVLVFLLFLCFGLLFSKEKKSESPLSATAFKLNTIITVTIYDSTDETILNESMELLDHYESIFSRTDPSSELYKLNHRTLPKKGDAFQISDELSALIAEGLRYSQLSGGAFDITIEPISSKWDFTSGKKVIPSQEEIDALLPHVNYENVLLDGNLVRFRDPQTGIDLGAVAKGYIADRMKEFLLSKGVKSATINLGGNVLCIGNKPDGSPFHIGVQKPFSDRGETLTTLSVSDRSIVSSGTYERYFEKDGKQYHHILNSKTGYPYDNSLVSVTILSDRSVDGDGLSTSCFTLGLEKGMELINSLQDVDAVFVTEDGQLHYSDHLKGTAEN